MLISGLVLAANYVWTTKSDFESQILINNDTISFPGQFRLNYSQSSTNIDSTTVPAIGDAGHNYGDAGWLDLDMINNRLLMSGSAPFSEGSGFMYWNLNDDTTWRYNATGFYNITYDVTGTLNSPTPHILSNYVFNLFYDDTSNNTYLSTDNGLIVIEGNTSTSYVYNNSGVYNITAAPTLISSTPTIGQLKVTFSLMNGTHIFLGTATDAGVPTGLTIIELTTNTSVSYDSTGKYNITTTTPSLISGTPVLPSDYIQSLYLDNDNHMLYMATGDTFFDDGVSLTILNLSSDTITSYSTATTPATLTNAAYYVTYDNVTNRAYVNSYLGTSVIDLTTNKTIINYSDSSSPAGTPNVPIGDTGHVFSWIDPTLNTLYISTVDFFDAGGLTAINLNTNASKFYDMFSDPVTCLNAGCGSVHAVEKDYRTGKLYVATEGGLMILDTVYDTPATMSNITDVGTTPTERSISWSQSLSTGSNITVSVREGPTDTPDGSWTQYTQFSSASDFASFIFNSSGNYQYIQWLVNLSTTNTTASPSLNELNVTTTTLLACGDTITSSKTLIADLTGCSGNGLNIGADSLTIDCAGHTISGTGSGIGINATTTTNGYNVIVQNCTISNFATSINASGAYNGAGNGFNGGNVNLTNSNITNISSYGGLSDISGGGIGGSITITDSSVATADSHGGSAPAGTGGNGTSITITNSNVTTADSRGGEGWSGGNGASITITNSNVTTINSYGSDSTATGTGGNGASITITNSNVTTINSYGGDGPDGSGNGGNINSINSTLNLSSITMDLQGGADIGGGAGTSGTLTLNTSGFYNSNGEVRYAYMQTQNVSFGSILSITSNLITVNSSTYANYNSSANITLNGVAYAIPKVLRDGVDCPSNVCTILSTAGGNVLFNVTGFTNYSIGDGTAITTCQNLSVENTTYTLQNNVTAPSTCFNVTANNVTLDCQGHSITGTDAADTYGINSQAYDNLRIKNCAIYDYYFGVYLFGSSVYSTIENNSIYSNAIGISIAMGSDHANITNNTASSGIIGIRDEANNITTSNNALTNNNYGYYTTSGAGFSYKNTLVNNTLSGNSVNDLRLSAGGPPHARYKLKNQLAGSYDLDSIYLEIEKTGIGEINFSQTITGSGTNLSEAIQISSNLVYVNSSGETELNKSANLTLNGLAFTDPVMLRDGAVCPPEVCTFQSYAGGILRFNVSGFTTYSARENDTAPTVTLQSPADASTTYTNASSASIAFTFYYTDDFSSTANCTLHINGGNNGTNTSVANNTVTSMNVNSIASGAYSWNVTCIDNASLESSSANRTLTVVVDPTVPTIDFVDPTPGNGTLNTTNVQVINVSHTEANPDKIRLYVDGAVDSTRGYTGTFTNFTKVFADGIHTYYVWLNDTAGNSNQTATRTISIDTTAPAVTLQSPANAAPIGTNTSSANVTFTFYYTDAVSATASCTLHLNGGNNGTNASVANNTVTSITVNEIGIDSYSWNMTCIDLSGFQGNSSNRTFTVTADPTPPMIAYIDPTPMDNDLNTTNTQTINVSHTEANPDKIMLYINGIADITQGYTGAFTNFTKLFADGIYTYYVKANDTSGNSNQTVARILKIDTTAPAVTLQSPSNAVNLTAQSIIFYFYYTDAASTTANCTLHMNGGNNGTDAAVVNNTSTGITVSNIAAGSYWWNVTCLDQAGFTGYSANRTFNQTCGNAVIDTGEQCESGNLSGQTCATLLAGYTGTLACSSSCAFNTAGCYVPPSCSPSWSCTAWSPATCPISGTQTRTCTDSQCGSTPRSESQSCTYLPPLSITAAAGCAGQNVNLTVTSGGSPVNGASIAIRRDGSTVGSASTDSDGKATYASPSGVAGSYTFEASKTSYVSSSAAAYINLCAAPSYVTQSKIQCDKSNGVCKVKIYVLTNASTATIDVSRFASIVNTYSVYDRSTAMNAVSFSKPSNSIIISTMPSGGGVVIEASTKVAITVKGQTANNLTLSISNTGSPISVGGIGEQIGSDTSLTTAVPDLSFNISDITWAGKTISKVFYKPEGGQSTQVSYVYSNSVLRITSPISINTASSSNEVFVEFVVPCTADVPCYTGPVGTQNVGACHGGVYVCGADGILGTQCTGQIIPTFEASSPCNNIDDNCDGAVDGFYGQCYNGAGTPGVGKCVYGSSLCSAGVWGTCVGAVYADPVETCGNGIDDDCNGVVDNTCPCTADVLCGTDAGECVSGVYRCVSGVLNTTTCVGSIGPVAEICDNGMDENCNGVVDDGCPCIPGAVETGCYTGLAGTAGVGICHTGYKECRADRTWSSCINEVTPLLEACTPSGINEDCDMFTDEGCPCVEGTSEPCGTDVGECAAGVHFCIGGTWQTTCQGFKGPVDEICNNGLDEDCDGVADDGCPCIEGSWRNCGSGVGECEYGREYCVSGVWSGSCIGGVGPTTEICDGLDNNCNYQTDEVACACTADKTCGTDTGYCVSGIQRCISGTYGPCEGAIGPIAEICGNLIDEDCNGADAPCSITCTQDQECYTGPVGTEKHLPCQMGVRRCILGILSNTCEGQIVPRPEQCGNLIDEDCNGLADDVCISCTAGQTRACYSGPLGTAGVGICIPGFQTCPAIGQWTNQWPSCVGQITPLAAEDCSSVGIDDNCNGWADEGCRCTPGVTAACYTGPAGTSGIGVCKGGTSTCQANFTWSACVGQIVPTPDICNGLDDNCNGVKDEGCTCINGQTQTCGVSNIGECKLAMQTCINGVWNNTNCIGAVYPKAETCNNKDDDCNGFIDNMAAMNCSAYKGICGVGTQTCAAGVWTGCPFPQVETCNGLDDDCDGTIDEGCPCVSGQSYTCGPANNTGECRIGTSICINGVLGNCTGAVYPTAETCNSKDDNCNGVIDDNILPRDCNLSKLGICAVGQESCNGGTYMGCMLPQAEVCDGLLDENCDGIVDEGCVCLPGETQVCGPATQAGICRQGIQTCQGGTWSDTCAGAVYPSSEQCGNGVDEDCNGVDDQCPECRTGAECDSGKCVNGNCLAVTFSQRESHGIVVDPGFIADEKAPVTDLIPASVLQTFGIVTEVKTKTCEIGLRCSASDDCFDSQCIDGTCACCVQTCVRSGDCCTGYCEQGRCKLPPSMAPFIIRNSDAGSMLSGCAGLIRECLPGEQGCVSICNAMTFLLAIVGAGTMFAFWKSYKSPVVAVGSLAIPIALSIITYPFVGVIISLLMIGMLFSK